MTTASRKPFKDDDYLSSGSVATLHDWLEKNAQPEIVIAGDYTVGNLLGDLNKMLDGMWCDGIDARGEDA